MRVEKTQVVRIELETAEAVWLLQMCKAVARTRIADQTTKDFAKKLLINIYIPEKEEEVKDGG